MTIDIQIFKSEWETVATFTEDIDFDIIINCAFHIAQAKMEGVGDVCVISNKTGEVFWSYLDDFVSQQREYDNCDPDWGYNEDCGFDPYMGCYTDDC